jgi:8-oxo-(d)GTP phosphatase
VTDEILAGGAVLWRSVGEGVEIALIHRSRYDDWSLPKGKLDAGESLAAAAVREVREETGVSARLGPWLRDVRYAVADGYKAVTYWSAQVCSATPFTPNDEVDALRWVALDKASAMLSYAHDADVVARFVELGPPTSLLLLLRHAKAGSRHDWDGDDLLFGPDRIATAPPLRCRDTVVPLADSLGLPITDEPLVSEDRFATDPDAAVARVRELAAMPGVGLVCSQGGVIPGAVTALAGEAALPVSVDRDDVPSKKASTWVLGLRDGALVSADYYPRPGG